MRWLVVSTRPDIAHVVGVVSRYMQNPGKKHWQSVHWILRYLRGTSSYCLCFGGSNVVVQGFVDFDHSGDRDDGRSTTGYVFTVGETAVSWFSNLQKIVSLSTTKAEYVAATEASEEMIWLQWFIGELGWKEENSTLWSDNQSAIHLAKNSAFYARTKHIQLRYHFIRQVLEDGQLKLDKVDRSRNPVDMLTKVVDRGKLSLCSNLVNLR